MQWYNGRPVKPARVLLLLLPGIACDAKAPPVGPPPAAAAPRADAARLLDHARTLSSPAFDGRRTGTEGAAAAAGWIEQAMRRAGLSDVRFQPFTHVPPQEAPIACKNVLGQITGRRPNRLIVIGAHYDHLGSTYPGADDNASGVAGLLELARLLAAGPQPQYTLLFAAFSGEEIGLIGSSQLARTPPATVAVMLNLDMIGRLRDGKLTVGGIATGEGFEAIVRNAAREDLPLELLEGGVSPSDNTAFFSRDIPVLWFWTGAHPDHHQPTDTPDKLDATGMARIVELAARIVAALDALEEPPAFHRVAGAMPGPDGTSGAARRRAKLGTMPDYNYRDGGVLLQVVRDDGPAARGGLRAWDVLVELAGRKVKTIDDYAAILADLEGGKPYAYTVLRDGLKVTGTVTPTW
jgi:hypothetical protein